MCNLHIYCATVVATTVAGPPPHCPRRWSSDMPTLNLNVNGQDHAVVVNSLEMPLLWVLRDLLGLTGTKYGCGIEICGACTVLVNNQPEKSCEMDVSSAVGKRITTIE